MPVLVAKQQARIGGCCGRVIRFFAVQCQRAQASPMAMTAALTMQKMKRRRRRRTFEKVLAHARASLTPSHACAMLVLRGGLLGARISLVLAASRSTCIVPSACIAAMRSTLWKHVSHVPWGTHAHVPVPPKLGVWMRGLVCPWEQCAVHG